MGRSLTARVLRDFFGVETSTLAQVLRAPVARFGRREGAAGADCVATLPSELRRALCCIFETVLKHLLSGRWLRKWLEG